MSPEGNLRRLLVAPDDAGNRLDRYLTALCPDLSRAFIQKLIADGEVLVGDQPAKASRKLAAGEQVAIRVPEPAPTTTVATPMALAIIYEDADVLVVDKPAGLVVHPAPGHTTDTLVNALLARYPNLSVGGALRPGIVHRLDKDTSGLMVVAKNDRAMADLVSQMQRREVLKEYLALVDGHLPSEQGIIEAPVGRDRGERKRMAVVEHGRHAITHFAVVERLAGHSLLRLRLETGRTHQIRVHLAALGHAVEGDPVYGRRECHCPGLRRHFLHATRLGFRLPSNSQLVTFDCPLPPDLAACLDHLRSQHSKA